MLSTQSFYLGAFQLFRQPTARFICMRWMHAHAISGHSNTIPAACSCELRWNPFAETSRVNKKHRHGAVAPTCKEACTSADPQHTQLPAVCHASKPAVERHCSRAALHLPARAAAAGVPFAVHSCLCGSIHSVPKDCIIVRCAAVAPRPCQGATPSMCCASHVDHAYLPCIM